MENKKKQLIAFFIFSVAAALVSAGARCVMTLLYLDSQYGVYQAGAILPTLSHILTFLLCLAAAVFGFLLARDLPCPVMPEPDSFVAFASSVTAFLMAASSLYSVYNMVVGVASVDKFTIARIIVSIPSLIYFFAVIRPNATKSPVLAFFSFFPIIWFILDIVPVYFDRTLLITSPAKAFRQLAILAIMIALLNESRTVIGRTNGNLFLAASGVAPIVVFTSSIPALLFSKKLFVGETDDFICYAVEFAASLFVLARLLSFAKSPLTLPKQPKTGKEKKV